MNIASQKLHESEWIYSTFLSRGRVFSLNKTILSLGGQPHIIEFIIFACGYAFNPVMLPVWSALIYSIPSKKKPILQMLFYLASVLITLIFTELGKASFATTRPEKLLLRKEVQPEDRRYGSLVSSLKSKHSFPSGDCAQAMNVSLFLYRYTPVSTKVGLASFVVGVCFARIFYRCHWIEDCLGGVLLSFLLHHLLIPLVPYYLEDIIIQLLTTVGLY